MSKAIHKKIIPIFIPHLGCPNDCIFCNQKKITGKQTLVTADSISMEMKKSLSTVRADQKIEIAFYGGSFTAIDECLQQEYLSIANGYIEKDQRITDIRISTRPDAIDEATLTRLKKQNVSIIELGVQSLDQEVLAISKRGHDLSCVYRSGQLIRDAGFQLGIQMMIGLPGDTKERVLYTCREIVKIKPDFVRVYPVLVIEDTELNDMMEKGEYQPWTVEEIISVGKKINLMFIHNDITVIRIGLQNSEEIHIGKSVRGGPFHPAMGELILTASYRDFLEDYVITNNIKGQLILQCPKNQISQWIGQNKSSIHFFKRQFEINLCVKEKKTTDEYILMNGALVTQKMIRQKLWELYFGGGN